MASMSVRTQRACIWVSPVMVLVWAVGFAGFAGFLPPPAPTSTVSQIVAMYDEHRTAIKIGLALTAFGSALLAPFIAVLTVQMKRIEGAQAPLAYIQLALGALFIIEFFLPTMVLQAAAYRANRSPEIIYALNDLGWLLFVGVVGTAVVQAFVIGVAILQDQRATPLFPRWAGYFNIWVAALFSPGAVIVFFTDGPFAWNGVIAFWLPACTFGLWVFVMSYLLLKATNTSDPAEARTDSATELGNRRQIELLSAEVSALRAELLRVGTDRSP